MVASSARVGVRSNGDGGYLTRHDLGCPRWRAWWMGTKSLHVPPPLDEISRPEQGGGEPCPPNSPCSFRKSSPLSSPWGCQTNQGSSIETKLSRGKGRPATSPQWRMVKRMEAWSISDLHGALHDGGLERYPTWATSCVEGKREAAEQTTWSQSGPVDAVNSPRISNSGSPSGNFESTYLPPARDNIDTGQPSPRQTQDDSG